MRLRRAYDRISDITPNDAFRVGLHRMATLSFLIRARDSKQKESRRAYVVQARAAHHDYLRTLGAI